MIILKMDNLNYYHMCLNEDEDLLFIMSPPRIFLINNGRAPAPPTNKLSGRVVGANQPARPQE